MLTRTEEKKKKKGQMVVNKKTLFLNQSEKPSSQRRVRKETHSLFVMTCSGHCGAGTGRLLLLLVLFGTLRVLSFCGRSDCRLQRSFLPSPFCLGHSHGMEREKSCQSCTIGTKKKESVDWLSEDWLKVPYLNNILYIVRVIDGFMAWAKNRLLYKCNSVTASTHWSNKC